MYILFFIYLFIFLFFFSWFYLVVNQKYLFFSHILALLSLMCSVFVNCSYPCLSSFCTIVLCELFLSMPLFFLYHCFVWIVLHVVTIYFNLNLRYDEHNLVNTYSHHVQWHKQNKAKTDMLYFVFILLINFIICICCG
jgi:hypothetical protein